jgi:hypothetical protein
VSKKDKEASSQAAWALLTEGVSEARVLTHRVRHMLDRAQAASAESKDREAIYRTLGDFLEGAPERLSNLERVLDRTGYALSKMGEEFLRGRIPLDDRYMVDDAVKAVPGFSPGTRRKSSPSPSRVTERFLVRRKG